jgi:DNA-binding CsgD family transcriptional regulator
MGHIDSQRSSQVGLLLLNAQLHPIHYNAEAALILGFPKKGRQVPSLDAVFPSSVLRLESPSQSAQTSGIEFVSGRRRYICRVFKLDPHGSSHGPLQPRLAIVLERGFKRSVDITNWSQQFHLTTRERETVQFLLKGLTSREIAHEMHISPNTVKSFLKLVMAKVGATTRTGLLASIFERVS